jgi:hypothetical protein
MEVNEKVRITIEVTEVLPGWFAEIGDRLPEFLNDLFATRKWKKCVLKSGICTTEIENKK